MELLVINVVSEGYIEEQVALYCGAMLIPMNLGGEVLHEIFHKHFPEDEAEFCFLSPPETERDLLRIGIFFKQDKREYLVLLEELARALGGSLIPFERDFLADITHFGKLDNDLMQWATS